MMEKETPALGGVAVAQEFQHALGKNRPVPRGTLRLKAVWRKLNEQNSRPAIPSEEVVERKRMGNGKDSVRDGYVAGFEASIPLDEVRVDACHSGRIAKDQNVTIAVVRVENSIVRSNPDAGSVPEKKIGVAKPDARWNGDKHQ